MRILAVIGALAIIVAIGAAVFFFGGFYSVAGTAEDSSVVTWALTRVRTASIDRHAQDQSPASINEAASVQAGAKAFATQGCPTCHGGPGVTWAKFSEGLSAISLRRSCFGS
jgi:mono/diheme cytochrome c family protein